MKRLITIGMLSLVLLLSACGNGGSSATTADVVQQFKDDGLEVGKTSELPNKEFGNIREEGIRLLIPSLGDDAGGRVFLFDNEDDMATAKSYYDELGNAGAMFYSHTHTTGNLLLQMNGDMSDEDFKKYADSMDKLK